MFITTSCDEVFATLLIKDWTVIAGYNTADLYTVL